METSQLHIGLIIYGSLETMTGGYIYDRKVLEYLQSSGHRTSIFSFQRSPYLLNILDNFSGSMLEKVCSAGLDLLLQDELNHPSLFIWNRRLRRRTSLPVLTIVHALRSKSDRGALDRALAGYMERRYLSTVDGYVCVSEHTRSQVRDLFPHDLPDLVAYPAGDRFPETGVSIPEYGLNEPLKLLFIGNLTPNKQLHLLLRALTLLPSDSCELTVVGGTDDYSGYARSLLDYVTDNNLTSSVHFFGRITDPERIADLYRENDLLVLPSQSEGFPLVVPEAAGFGVPAIVTSNSGMAEFIQSGVNGFLCDADDPRTLISPLQTLMNNREKLRRMSAAAAKRFRSHPTWEETGALIHRFIQQFIRRRQSN